MSHDGRLKAETNADGGPQGPAAPRPARGRLRRAAGTLLSVGLADAIAYRGEMVIWLLTTNTPLIMLLLWHAVAADGPVGPYGQSEFTAYFLTTLGVRLLTGAWVVWEMNYEARQGTLSMRLVKPMHPFITYAAENLGAWPLRLALSMPLWVAIYAVVGPQAYTDNATLWALFPLAIVGSWALNFCSMLLVGTLSLRWHSSLSVFDVWLAGYYVLSGYVVPLDLFPPDLAAIVQMLPFAYQISFPVNVALGKVAAHEAVMGLALQWSYVALLLGLAEWSWRRGLRRYEAFGG